MEASYRHPTRRPLATSLLAAGVVAAAWAGLAPAADAGHRHPRRAAHHRHVSGHRHPVHVPRVIVAADRASYRPFYAGRVYYAPHRHVHVRYNFPVLVGGAVAYRPYFYCGDHVFLSGSVALPRFAAGFRFGPVGGYYQDYGYVPYDGPVGCDRHGYDEHGYEYEGDDEYEDEDEYEDDDDD